MNEILIDTNIYSYAMRGDIEIIEALQQNDQKTAKFR
jgi:rRNA-processing protein FCF1